MSLPKTKEVVPSASVIFSRECTGCLFPVIFGGEGFMVDTGALSSLKSRQNRFTPHQWRARGFSIRTHQLPPKWKVKGAEQEQQ